MERSLILIKPDAVLRGLSGAIIDRFESRGLKLVGLKSLKMDEELALKHYAPHKEKPFFDSLVSYITSGPVVAAVLEGDDAVSRAREIMGATDTSKAETGTIRKDYGLDIEKNSIHGSDSVTTAENEIGLFFTTGETVDYRRTD